MNNIKYGIIEECYFLGDICRKAYGIAAYANSDTDGVSTVVASVGEITDDKSKIADFVENCNSLQLSLIHFFDVVEDFINE